MGVGRAALLEHDDNKKKKIWQFLNASQCTGTAFNCNGVERQKTRLFLAFIVSLKSESIPIFPQWRVKLPQLRFLGRATLCNLLGDCHFNRVPYFNPTNQTFFLAISKKNKKSNTTKQCASIFNIYPQKKLFGRFRKVNTGCRESNVYYFLLLCR